MKYFIFIFCISDLLLHLFLHVRLVVTYLIVVSTFVISYFKNDTFILETFISGNTFGDGRGKRYIKFVITISNVRR